MKNRTASVLLFALFVVAAPTAAQTITTGVIQGSVTDATGAVLPGAVVEVKNVDTNSVESRTTDGDGRFVVLQLPPGRYTVTFKLAGFSTLVQEEHRADGRPVHQPAAAGSASSAVQETVTVSGTPTVETTRSGRRPTRSTRRRSRRTPILGRKFEDLLTLTPGVSVVQGPDGDEITFAGQRGIFNNISLDGGDYNNGFFGEQAGGQRAAIDITLDAVKEFQVIATGAPAEFGRTAGGVVNVITKSGTNEIHGSLFYFQRLEALTGELSDGTTLEEFHREQFGGTIGGPIQPRQGVLLRRARGDHRQLRRGRTSAAPIGTPCPVPAPTLGAERGADQRQPRLPAAGAAELLPDAPRPGRGPADRASDLDRRRCC